jgi:hypothetical protein
VVERTDIEVGLENFSRHLNAVRSSLLEHGVQLVEKVRGAKGFEVAGESGPNPISLAQIAVASPARSNLTSGGASVGWSSPHRPACA